MHLRKSEGSLWYFLRTGRDFEGWLKSTAKKSERWARKRVAVLGHKNVDIGVSAATALYIQIECLVHLSIHIVFPRLHVRL